MILIRILVIATIFWLVYYIYKQITHLINQSGQAEKKVAAEMPMVKCKQCGIHLPKDQAIAGSERYYCCEDHRKQDESTK